MGLSWWVVSILQFGLAVGQVRLSVRVLFHLRQVYGEIVGEPAVSGLEGLRLGGLGATHVAEAVAERLEVHQSL